MMLTTVKLTRAIISLIMLNLRLRPIIIITGKQTHFWLLVIYDCFEFECENEKDFSLVSPREARTVAQVNGERLFQCLLRCVTVSVCCWAHESWFLSLHFDWTNGWNCAVQVQVFTNKCVTDVVFATYESLPNVQYSLIYYWGLNCSENFMII